MALFQKIKQRIRDGALREFVQEVKWLWQYIRRYRAAVLIHILLGVLGILMSLASSVATSVVMYVLPFIPFHQLNEPSSFCSSDRVLYIVFSLYVRLFLLK